MSELTIGVIGTGPEPDNIVWGESAAMAYRHGKAYSELPECDLVTCADIVRENAQDFADEFDIPDENVFEDYQEMLYEVEPDVVSVCTPVPTHADIVIGAAETDVPGAIHCEKPMADRWDDSKRMAAIADEHDVQLTFNHQRRFDPAWQEASRLLNDGAIGELERVEMGGKNLYDFGTHLVDLCNHYAGESSAEWVIGQVHYTDEDVRYGVHNENQAIATWAYGDGTFGHASTGSGTGDEAIGCLNRLHGSQGQIEVYPADVDADLRYRTDETDGWVTNQFEDVSQIKRGIDHICSCLKSGDQPVLSAEHALRASEIIFAAWESARQRSRIDLPLETEGNALTEMVESGKLNPVESE